MKTYYDDVLKEQNTGLHYPSFKNGDGVKRLVAAMPDDKALGEWEVDVRATRTLTPPSSRTTPWAAP